MSEDELYHKGIRILEKQLGFIDAQKFLIMIREEGRNAPEDYTEWRRENLFENMTEKEFMDGLMEYAKTHNLE